MPDRAQEERERMTDERFAAWANEIGLTPAQADKVRYVIDREYERGVSSEAEPPRLTREDELLREECEKRGLPTSLQFLLRHLQNNFAAERGALRYSNDLLRARLHELEPDDPRWTDPETGAGAPRLTREGASDHWRKRERHHRNRGYAIYEAGRLAAIDLYDALADTETGAGHDGNQGLDDGVEGAGDEPKLYGGEDRVAELERALEDACSYLPPDIARRYLSLERFNAMFPEAGGWNG
jgi:hypothetical protein